MKLSLSLGLLAALASTAFGQAKLTGIETSKVGDGLQIVIKGEGLTEPRTQLAWKGTSYIVEFNAHLVGKASRTNVGFAGVQYVQTTWYKPRPPLVRVHVKGSWVANPTVTKINGDWVICVNTTADPLSVTPNKTEPTIVPLKAITDSDEQAMSDAEKLLLTEVPVSPPPSVEKTSTQTAQGAPVISNTPVAQSNPTPDSQSTKVAASLGATLGAQTQQRQTVKPQPVASANKATRHVSLDFVGTDVVQIIKALSMQAGVNIVTSPDVSPSDKPVKLSISLGDVELDAALSYVTAMANLRYARVGNTYVVTPAATFSAAIRQILQRNAEGYQTRVVNLVSGEAEKIREATLKALPPEGEGGYYEIIVPNTGDMTASPNPTAQPQDGKVVDPQAQPETQPNNQVPNNAVSTAPKNRAYYLLVMGEPSRLGAVEDYVHSLDAKVAASFSLSRSNNVGTVAIPIQSGETVKIKGMIEKLLEGNPRAGDYSITESSVKELAQGEQAIKFLLMIGPEAELSTLKNFAVALDKELCRPLGIAYTENVSEMVKDYEIVELMYLEPIIAAQDLKGRFKDLWVTVVPDTVTPGLKGEAESKKDEAPTDAGDQNAPGGGKQEKVESKLKKQVGLEPMRLILRGAPATIAEAKRYLSLIDVAPRQIALEMRVMDLTKEEALNAGLDWTLGLGSFGKVIAKNAGTGSTSVNGKIGSASVTAVLDSLANDRRLIARPNALVSDGREAHLFVGDTIRYIKQIQSTQQGITVITDELQVGSQFDIKARVGADGSIALDLGQKFTLLTSWLSIPGGGQLPQTSDRTSNVFVNMKSGETIAIGGLILDTDIKNYSGIPILKDLPVIGRLFGRTNNSKSRTEIVFFLTAVEVNADNRAGAASPRVNLNRNPDPMGEYKKTGKNDR